MWERVESLPEEIKKVWCTTPDRGNLGKIVWVVGNIRMARRKWSQQQFSAVTTKLDTLRLELDEARAQPNASRETIQAISDRMDEVLYHEEMMWLQHSRIT
jgi:hypothetical protein